MGDGPCVLTFEEAIALLPDGDTIHCFMNPNGGVLFGADWAREDVLKALAEAPEIHATGETAQAMRHGLAVKLNRTRDWAFFEAARSPRLAAPEGGADG